MNLKRSTTLKDTHLIIKFVQLTVSNSTVKNTINMDVEHLKENK